MTSISCCASCCARLAGRLRAGAVRLVLAQQRFEALDLGGLRVRQARILEQPLGDLHALALVHELQLQLVDPPLELLHRGLQLDRARSALDRASAALVRLEHRDGALSLLERSLAVAHHRLELLQDLLALLPQARLELDLVGLAERSTQRARTLGLRDLREATLDLLPVELVVDAWPSHDRSYRPARGHEKDPPYGWARKSRYRSRYGEGQPMSILRHVRDER